MTIKQISFLILVFGSVFSNNLLEAQSLSIDPKRLPVIMKEAHEAATERYLAEALLTHKYGKTSLEQAIVNVSFTNILLEEQKKAFAKEHAFNHTIAINLRLNHQQQ